MLGLKPPKCRIGNNDIHDATQNWNIHSFTVLDNIVALFYLLKKRQMKSCDKVSVSKEIWDCLLPLIAITAEYLLRVINFKAG